MHDARGAGDTKRARVNRQHRTKATLRQERDAALRQLGIALTGEPWTRDMLELDHSPPLALRARTADGGYDPPENDPEHLYWMLRADHRGKTVGSKHNRTGDVSMIAKAKRCEKKEREFRAKVLAKTDPSAEAIRPRPKRKIVSRGFERKRKSGK